MKIHHFFTVVPLSGLLASGMLVNSSLAADEVPPPPDLLQNGDKLPERDVTIVHKKDAVIEEVRINGQLRYAKITPSSGPAYYMVDTDGDGLLDTQHDDPDNPPINRWILMEW